MLFGEPHNRTEGVGLLTLTTQSSGAISAVDFFEVTAAAVVVVVVMVVAVVKQFPILLTKDLKEAKMRWVLLLKLKTASTSELKSVLQERK